jgi:hypothetical protein
LSKISFEAPSFLDVSHNQMDTSGSYGGETINGATNVLERDDQTDALRNSAGENLKNDSLTDLVRANADVLVRCPWLDNAVVTFSTASIAYSEKVALITAENIHIVASIMGGLLANRVIETEEPAEEDEPEEEELIQAEEADQKINTKKEVPKEQEGSKKADADRQSKREGDAAKHLEHAPSKAEKTSNQANVMAVEAEGVADLAHGESKQVTRGAVQAEAAADQSSSSADATGGGLTAPEAKVVKSSTSNSVRESTVNGTGLESVSPVSVAEDQLNAVGSAIKSEVEAKQQIPTVEIPEANAADQEALSLTAPIAIEVIADFADDTPEISIEKIGAAEDELALATLDYQMGANSLTDFVEEEVLLLDHFEEAGQDPDEIYMFSDIPALELVEGSLEAEAEASVFQVGSESNAAAEQEISSSEQPAQINLTVEEIEDSLLQLTESIEASGPETPEKLNEILDKIIEVPAKLEEFNGENIITEAEAQEELEELFTELLDRMAIDYAPELIESLAYLTLKWHLVDEIEKLRNEEEADEAPQDSGIHKIIQKLLAGLSKIKKAMAQACAIGKSALQLYTFNFAI